MTKYVFYITFIWATLACFGSFAQEYEQKEEDHTHNFSIPESFIYNTKNWTNTNILNQQEVVLWNMLDSGYVIIHEYFMIDCRPCITAGKGLEKVVASLKEKFPGKIKYYQTVYENESTEKMAKKWVKENKFTPDALFIKGAEEVAFYGGMGMPTIVVVGDGPRHKGFYKRQGYTPLENGKIIKAVRHAAEVSKSKFVAE
ncbi:hypothetical protein DBR32_05780 [Taibaiella sp. KBW10]|uniref:hypothetical protein n=1 Tax=Taibaiella sp. KBW10 TaxID=2153357 RepID=UPI000F5B5E5F|nr:hypothetical protein [Taibaiella sp. KBW10]RQO31470.1 hypothetical protein DBR32_05780 [Taibaiella sp. KBW10]